LCIASYFAQNELKLIYPGTKDSDIFFLEYSNSQFKWHKLKSASEYSVLISVFEKDFYKLIYNSADHIKITDTTFYLPGEIIKNNSKYRWNVKAKLNNGKSILSDFFYFQTGELKKSDLLADNISENSDFYNQPTEPGFRIAKPELTIKLEKKTGIKFNQIYIAKKIKNKYKLIFKSGKLSLKENLIKIPPKLLTDNSFFRWNVKTVNKNGKSAFSEVNYFYTDFSVAKPILKKNFYPSNPIYPGKANNNFEIIRQLNPELKWISSGDSLFSQIFIFEISDGKEKIVFATDKLKPQVNRFTVPPNILKFDSSYVWQIKSFATDGNEIYSDKLYFRIEEKKEIFVAPKIIPKEKEEIFLALKYAGIVNTTVNAIYDNGSVYLPMLELFSNLEAETKFDGKKNLFEVRNFLSHKNLTVDLTQNQIHFGDSVYQLNQYKFYKNDFDIFLPKNFYSEITGIDTRIDMSNLTVNINSYQPLPVLNRKLREDKYGYLYRNENKIDQGKTDFKREQKYFNFGVADYQLTYNVNKYSSPSTYYMFGGGGEILGGDIHLFSRGNFRESKFGESHTEAQWKYVFEKNSYVTSFSAGTIDFEGLQYTTYDGISITNTPVEPRTEFGKIKISDTGNPNSTIELYLNNQLFDVVKSDATGNFSFDLPLNYGTSLVKLKFYGNFGEYQEKTKLYQIPVLLLQENEINYNLNVGKQNITRDDLRSFNIAYGFNDWITSKFGIEHLQTKNQKAVFYNSTSARLFDSYFANLSFSPENFYNFSVDAMLPSQLALDFEYSKFLRNGFFNQANLTDKISAHIFYPLIFSETQLNLQSFYSLSKTKQNTLNDFSFGISSCFSYFSPSVNYHLVNVNTGKSVFNNNTIDAGFNWSLNFLHYYLNFMQGSILTARYFYNLTQSRSENYSVSFSFNLFEKGRLQIIHTENLANSFSLTQLNALFYFDQTQFSTSISKETFTASVLGSVNYNMNDQQFSLLNKHQIDKSGAVIRLFVDENNNGVFDKTEYIIKEGKVDISVAELTYTKNGMIIAHELNPYTIYKIKIREESIKNPLLIPNKKEFSFETEPNTFREINIPFYEAGEVSGKVIKKLPKKEIPIAGLKIHIQNIITEETNTITTFSDGSFYYFGLLPGKYKLVLDKEQLTAINATLESNEFYFEISNEQKDKVNNFDIIIKRDF
jgi:hypothetical protein